MRFGAVPLDQAEGAVLAHSAVLPDGKLGKGRLLSAADVARLAAAGVAEVVVARLEPGDVPEDEAADRVARALAAEPGSQGLTVTAPFTGRVNLYAAEAGVLTVEAAQIDALNALDEAVTVATLDDRTRVAARQMVATVKIIPYAAPAAAVEAAERLAAAGTTPALAVRAIRRRTADLVLTRTPGMADKVLAKGAEAVRQRLAALEIDVASEWVVAHEADALAAALAAGTGEMALILTASATSDRADTGPAAVVAAGGRIERFGMPVDPGNLLFLGRIGARPVIGLPGCARSPKLNGADWVLERVAAGLDPSAEEIAGMGVGGLLMEIPSRPLPRAAQHEPAHRPRVGAVILAAGAARRMAGRDKLLEEIEGEPLLARVASEVARAGVEETVLVLRPGDRARAAAVAGLPVRLAPNPRAAEGMGTSVAAGVAALPPGMDGALIVLADMPEVSAADIDRILAAFAPGEGREIVRALTPDGAPGHPVLFGRRFFEALRTLGGDEGARTLLSEHREFVVEVTLPGSAAATDLDTPEDWERWRARCDAKAERSRSGGA